MSKDKDKFEDGIATAYERQIRSLWNFWNEKNHESYYDTIVYFFRSIGLPKKQKNLGYWETYKLIKKDQLAVQQTLERINSTDLQAVYDKYLSKYMFQMFRSYILDNVVAEGLIRIQQQKILDDMLELAKTKKDAEDIWKYLEESHPELVVSDGEYMYLDRLLNEAQSE